MGWSGCGHGSAPTQDTTPIDEAAEARAAERAQQRKVAELEHKLSTLKRRLVDAEANQVPDLPVEVRAPDEPAPDEREYGHVVGVDEDGVEIVYAGDAARPGSVTPRLPRHLEPTPPRRQPTRAQRAERPAASAPAPAPAPADDDALSGRPTIDQQLAEARGDVRLPVTTGAGPRVAKRVREAPAPSTAGPARAQARRTPPAQPARHSAPPPAPRPDTIRARTDDDVKGAYKRHLETLRAGDHEQAASGFRALIEAHPGHALADNAQYWLGESMYDRKQYRAALVEFERVIAEHPRGNKVPDALLKVGFCHLALGQPAQAREAFERVLARFPNSRPATLAAERMRAIEADEP